ncbi:MAG: endonuclease [Bacteroidaceae bacterium]|nr:endonuclease [Bacteroidaceae bacterium]
MKIIKRTYITLLLAMVAVWASAQGPNSTGTYYQAANGKKGSALKTALCGIIYDRTEKSYDYLWTAFRATDKRSDGFVWDMYSNITNFTFGTDQAGNYKKEGDVYNREHSFPKSWFGGEVMPMYSDLHHMYPTDGYVNNMRGNLPFGEVSNPTYSSSGGFSKVGPCSYSGYTGKVFEPADEYKGDFARTYFYMVTCYEEKLADWYSKNSESRATIDGSTYPAFQTWQLKMLMEWATADPVSEKEINRNNAVYGIQNNRNPFIDYPGLEQYIWGNKKDVAFDYDDYVQPDGSSSGSGTGGDPDPGTDPNPGGETEGGTDVIDLAFTGITENATTYSNWSGKSGSASSAVYAGNSAGGNKSIQLRSDKSSSGIVTTTSGGKVTKVVVTWKNNTTTGRTLDVYGKNTAYSTASDLYNSSTQGTKLGSIVYGTSTELTISGDYTFVGLRSNSGAMYITQIEITWDGGSTPVVKTDPTFNNLSDLSVNWETPLTLTKGTTGTPNFLTDGTVTLTSLNEAVATVDGFTITPVAVGTAMISVNTTATDAYNAGSVMFPITVNAPDGKTEAFVTETMATLDFTTNSWGLPEGSSNKVMEETAYSNDTYTIKLAGGGSGNGFYYDNTNKYLLIGKTGATLSLPSFDKAVTQIDVIGRSGASTNVRQNIYVGNTAVSSETTGAAGTNSYEINKLFRSAGTVYTLKVLNGYNTQITRIIVHFAENSLTKTLNSDGYASYCSEYPLDFSDYESAGYSAWQVTGVSGETITFAQVTGKVKGGTGLILKGEPGETVTLHSANSETTLDGNLLVGTIVDTYAETGQYFGLKGNEFVPVAASTVPAGKVLLPASLIAGDEVKVLNFVFEDEATRIGLTPDPSPVGEGSIYNLAGQRLQKMQRGINIVNGKKIFK